MIDLTHTPRNALDKKDQSMRDWQIGVDDIVNQRIKAAEAERRRTQILNQLVPITPSAAITNNGVGLNLIGDGGSGTQNTGKGLQTAGPNPSSPFYVGTAVSASFCASVTMKFNPATPSGQNTGNSPAFWLQNVNRYISNVTSGNSPKSVEIDIFECLPGTPPANCSHNSQIHFWDASPNSGNILWSSNSGSSGGENAYTSGNTYTLEVLRAADNGGTGVIRVWNNTTLSWSCTYTSSGTPSCTTGISGTASTGDLFNELESQQSSVIMFGVGYYGSGTGWPVQFTNFAVWHK